MFKLSRLILVGLIVVCNIYWINLTVLAADDIKQPLVYTVNIDNTVTAGTTRYIQRALDRAESNNADALVIILNTPGGLVDATLEIITAMSASAIPVITYVYPQGAIAASAGTFILLNGHIAAMSSQTTCGAAMPVALSSDGQTQAADQKTINFLAGHMRSIAKERGRPVEIAGKFVMENLSLDNTEALEKEIVDLNINSVEELLQQVDGMIVSTSGGRQILNTKDVKVINIPLSVDEKILGLVGNPSIAMILLMAGIFLLVFGLYSPGFFLPEILGTIGIILGLSGIGLFQGNLTAALLIILGAVLLVAELFTPTFGVMGIGGLISIVLGVLLFPVEPLMPTEWYSFFRSIALGVGVSGAIFISIVAVGLSKIRGRPPVQGEAEFSNSIALVIKDLNPKGYVKFRGEIWQAIVKNNETISSGQRVIVVKREGLLLTVKKVNDS